MKSNFVRLTLAAATALASSYALAADSAQRLVNLSTRTQVGTGTAAPVVGFVIGPGTQKQVLIRAIGPTLSSFGVSGTLPNPKLELYSGTTKISENTDWTVTSVG